MHTKSVIATIIFVILCIKFGQGLQCYEHAYCFPNACGNISQNIVTCKNDDDQCWKLDTPAGKQRGCGDDKCKVTGNVLGAGNFCCRGNLCNSSIQVKTTAIAIVLMSLIALVFQW